MSNLGWYQWMTTTAKKAGGPVPFMLGIAGLGYIAIRPLEAGAKKAYRTISKRIKTSSNKDESPVLTVLECGSSGSEVQFNIGDKIRVLESVDDGVLIEKIGDPNNPYVISNELLHKILKN